jgi:hypothetical protein
MKAETILILYIMAVAFLSFAVLAPVVPDRIILGPRCTGVCPMFVVEVHAYVSPTYFAFGFGTVLTLPGLYYSFHWSPWRYL